MPMPGYLPELFADPHLAVRPLRIRGPMKAPGKHRWRTQSFVQISDGRRISGEGEIDLASRTRFLPPR